jgi:Phosphotransferase enzyme family
MQTVPLHFSDLQLLHSFFCNDAEELTIHDPDQRLKTVVEKPVTSSKGRFNLSANGKDMNASMQFYFGDGNWNEGRRFIYINNPDGTMRWIIPAEQKTAIHLSLYNSESWRARLYKAASSLLFTAGKSNWLASGSFYVEKKIVESIENRYGILPGEKYSFFTGTRGNTRKVVLAVGEKKITHFIKIAISEQSKKLINNEAKMLKELNKYDFTTLSIPRVTDPRINGCARLTNVKPSFVIPAQRINDIHVRTLTELYAANHATKPIVDCAAWSVISNNMEWMQKEHELNNGLDELKTRRLIHLLRKLYNSMPLEAEIPVSVSHGDFTPWNMYCDEHRLYVYDWELSSNGIPMLFDLYHFILQSQVLIHHQNYPAIRGVINQTIRSTNVQRLVNKYDIETELHYRMYLLFTISYYLRLYINEDELLTQSHWMMDVWLDALEEVNSVH